MLQLKLWLKYQLFRILDALVSPRGPENPDAVVVVRLDAIGDYVLFRNFLGVLKRHPDYHNRPLVLIGNVLWRSLAEELDAESIARFIWINPQRFAKDVLYRMKTIKQLNRSCGSVINPVYSRDLLVQDMLVRKIHAPKKIAQLANASNRFAWHRRFSDSCYTKLHDTGAQVQFEFYRNSRFFELLLRETMTLEQPTLVPPVSAAQTVLPQRYAVLFIGANDPRRRWSMAKFAALSAMIKTKYQLDIVICGGPGDCKLADEFESEVTIAYTNMVGKTSLVKLAFLMQNAKIVVTNETAAAHIAVAVSRPPVVVLSNGNHYGRFTPYPEEMGVPYHPVYHPDLQDQLANWPKKREFVSSLSTDEIEVAQVDAELEKHLMPAENSK